MGRLRGEKHILGFFRQKLAGLTWLEVIGHASNANIHDIDVSIMILMYLLRLGDPDQINS